MSGYSIAMATLATLLYVAGAGLFIFVYSALMSFTGLLGWDRNGEDDVLYRLTQPVMDMSEVLPELPYQLGVTAAAGLLYGAPIVLWGLLSWPVIAFSGQPEVRIGQTTRIYAAVYALTLILFTVMLAIG